MKYARKCDVCNSGMNSGYLIYETEYYCSDSCLHDVYNSDEYDSIYKKDEGYYTEWDSETDAEYELINDELKEI